MMQSVRVVHWPQCFQLIYFVTFETSWNHRSPRCFVSNLKRPNPASVISFGAFSHDKIHWKVRSSQPQIWVRRWGSGSGWPEISRFISRWVMHSRDLKRLQQNQENSCSRGNLGACYSPAKQFGLVRNSFRHLEHIGIRLNFAEYSTLG